MTPLSRLVRTSALTLCLVWAGCASTPPAPRPLLVLLPPYLSQSLADRGGTAWAVTEAAREGLGTLYQVRTGAWIDWDFQRVAQAAGFDRTGTLDEAGRQEAVRVLGAQALGLLDVVPDESGTQLRVFLRVVDAASGATLWIQGGKEPGDLASGVHPVVDRLPRPPLSDPRAWEAAWALAPPLDPPAVEWKAALEACRAAGDPESAGHWADLILDRLRAPRDSAWAEARLTIRRLLDQEALGARTERVAAQLREVLATPSGSPRAQTLALVRFLTLVREAAPRSLILERREVTQAFRGRFGQDLAQALVQSDVVLVEGGSYRQGSDAGEADEGPVHPVTLPAFLMGRTEVTQALYESVTGFNPSLFSAAERASDLPVERVTWYDAVEFCNLLSKAQGLQPVYTLTRRNPASGYPIRSAEVTEDRSRTGYRLPSEAEWEWAARGGAAARGAVFAGAPDPERVAWYGRAAGGPQAVASKRPNEAGLYDMSGNVWEWCSDWYGPYPWQAASDPRGPDQGHLKVGRGGSWHAPAWMARVTSRSFDSPGSRSNNLGFRVARSLPTD